MCCNNGTRDFLAYFWIRACMLVCVRICLCTHARARSPLQVFLRAFVYLAPFAGLRQGLSLSLSSLDLTK